MFDDGWEVEVLAVVGVGRGASRASSVERTKCECREGLLKN